MANEIHFRELSQTVRDIGWKQEDLALRRDLHTAANILWQLDELRRMFYLNENFCEEGSERLTNKLVMILDIQPEERR